MKAFLEKNHAVVPDKIKPSLKEEGRTTNSYVFSEPDQDELIKALDPQWPGPIPHTLLVAPGRRASSGATTARSTARNCARKMLEYMGRFYVPEPEKK